MGGLRDILSTGHSALEGLAKLRQDEPAAASVGELAQSQTCQPESAPAKNRARGRRKPGEMNKTEARYAEHLEGQRVLGTVEWFMFEGLKLRLADKTFYTPDFAVMLSDGFIECHEVKGFWEDDARVKIKVAASMFPFKFIGFRPKSKKDGGGWDREEF